MDPRDQHSFRLLRAIEAGSAPSQRRLARSAGIALGLTNLLVRRLAQKGFVKITRVRSAEGRYRITPAGISELARMSREHLRESVRRYSEARDRIRARFDTLSAEWPQNDDGDEKRIAFYGAGELAEIGYVCLQGTDLKLVAVADGARARPFFGLPIAPTASLTEIRSTVDRIVVMSSERHEVVAAELERLKIPPEMVFWI